MPDTLAPDTLPARRTPEQQIAELQSQLDSLREHAANSKADAPPTSSIAKRRVVRRRRGGATLIAASSEADVPDSLALQLQTRIDAFAADLVQLIRRSTFEAMQAVIDAAATSEDATSNEPKVGSAALESAPVVSGNIRRRRKPSAPSSRVPLTLLHYERMAIERAIAEANGDVLKAAKALTLTRSSIYRRIRKLSIPTPAANQGRVTLAADDPVAASGAPASLDAYEKACIERALEEGGSVGAAAKLLGTGKSTLYRRMDVLGIPPPG